MYADAAPNIYSDNLCRWKVHTDDSHIWQVAPIGIVEFRKHHCQSLRDAYSALQPFPLPPEKHEKLPIGKNSQKLFTQQIARK